jgi:murein DD-endopeptidase MepM/ murein hydrolase activator NlpD
MLSLFINLKTSSLYNRESAKIFYFSQYFRLLSGKVASGINTGLNKSEWNHISAFAGRRLYVEFLSDIWESMEKGKQRKERREKRKKLIKKLRAKYRLVILDDRSFAEKFSLRLSPMNLFIWAGSLSVILILFTTLVIAWTPLREFIPGYPDGTERAEMINNRLVIEKMEEKLKQRDAYLDNILHILRGEKIVDTLSSKENDPEFSATTRPRSPEDSILRKKVELDEKYEIQFGRGVSIVANDNMYGIFFFNPLEGTLTQSFDPKTEHYGIDIASAQREAVKATLDGTVIFAGWTSDGGNEVHIQHDHNLISVYKHNSILLKKTGDIVKAGEPVGILGNSGNLTDGPHLHFELWHRGKPIDPQNYLIL